MLSWSAWANIAREITCAMLTHSPQITLHKKIIYNFVWIYLSQRCTKKLLVQCWPIWLTDNVYEENNVYNAESTLLRQYCTQKKTTRTALVQSAQTCFHRKTACSFKWVAAYFLTGYNILNNHSSFFQCWLGSSFMVFGTTMKVCWPWLEHCPHHKRLFEKKLSQVTENNPQFFLWMLLKRN